MILLELAQALREWIGRNGTYGRIIADNFVRCIPSASEDEEIQLFRYVEERMEEFAESIISIWNAGFIK